MTIQEQIKELATSFAQANKLDVARLNQEQHSVLLLKWALECGIPEGMRGTFLEGLRVHGFGGNASQFRQWLAPKAKDGTTPAKVALHERYVI